MVLIIVILKLYKNVLIWNIIKPLFEILLNFLNLNFVIKKIDSNSSIAEIFIEIFEFEFY